MTASTAFGGAHELPEFLAVVSSYETPAAAALAAAEWAAELLEAEICAVFEGAELIAQVGYPSDAVPREALAAVLAAGRGSLDVAGWGRCHAVTAVLQDSTPGHLLVARAETSFTAEEVSLIRAMARILSLSLRQLAIISSERRLRVEHEQRIAENERLVLALQERQELHEQLSYVQRAIALRSPLQEVLDAITRGASILFGGEIVGLYVRDSDDPDYLLLISASGIAGDLVDRLWRVPASVGIGGAVLREGRFIYFDDYQATADMSSDWKEEGIQRAMGIPVREDGRIVGALVVASCSYEQEFRPSERQMLQTFADHVSLALTDAHTTEAVRHAFHDPLTGLPNRNLLMDRLSHALSRARRDGRSLAVLFIDLDEFKAINDSLGHRVGDQVLIEASRRMRSMVRVSDTPARFGGDEFVILLTSDTPDVREAVATAERILSSLLLPITFGDRTLSINASIGVAISRAGAEGAEELIHNADVAMYQAKAAGRGRYVVFHPEMERGPLPERIDLGLGLRPPVERAGGPDEVAGGTGDAAVGVAADADEATV